MKILMLSYEFPPLGGGGARVVHGLSTELVRLGHAVDVVTMGFQGLPAEETVEGVQVHRIPCRRRRAHLCTAPEAFTYVAAALPRVRRLVRHQRYDLNHTHFIFPDGVLAWWLHRTTGLRYVITAHGSDVPGYNPDRLKLAHRLLAPAWRRVVRTAERVICPSRVLETLLRRQLRESTVTLIPNGIDPDRFHANGAPRGRRILMVSRLLERKGFQHALEALRTLPTDHEVHVVGDGPYRQALEVAADGIPVTFWGWMDHSSPELRRLYESASIFLLPSEAENFPIVLLEAMAAGLAIITTSGTGCAEVVEDAGLLVPAGDVSALREALRRLTEDAALCRQLGVAARRRLEERFSWRAVAQQYLDVYVQAAGRPAKWANT